MSLLLNKWKRTILRADWNDMQKYMISNRDDNVVVVAQTGMGKLKQVCYG